MIYDINLIPKVKKKASGEAVFITVSLCFCCTVLLGFFGFYMPMQQKLTLEKQIFAQEKELQSYGNSLETYTTLLNRVDEVSQTDLMLNTLKSSALKMTKFMNDIEKNIPQSIVVKRMSLMNGLLEIEGSSPSYQDVAQYIVNIRNIENVLDVTFMSATKDETMENVTMDTISEEGSSNVKSDYTKNIKGQVHNFSLNVVLDELDVMSLLLGAQAAAIITEGEGAVQE